MIWCIKTYIIAYVKIKKWRYTIQYVKPTAQLVFKINFQKVDQHAGGKWLIHDTKRRKDNQLQSLKLPCRISKLSMFVRIVARCEIKGSDGTVLNPIFWKTVQGQKHPGRWGIVEHQIPLVSKCCLKQLPKVTSILVLNYYHQRARHNW